MFQCVLYTVYTIAIVLIVWGKELGENEEKTNKKKPPQQTKGKRGRKVSPKDIKTSSPDGGHDNTTACEAGVNKDKTGRKAEV